MESIVLISIIAIAIFGTFFAVIKRYKRCPSDKLLVVYGKTGKATDSDDAATAQVYHGGGAFVWPVFQDYEYIDLKPMSIEVNLTDALSKQNIRINVPSSFTIAIDSDKNVRINAAERLLGLDRQSIASLAQDIIFGQMRQVIAQMTIEEINADRETFLENISKNLELELVKIGMKLINVNVTDIQDNSGYLEAIGKEAIAKALNEAKVSVATKNKEGAIGESEANKLRSIAVAEQESQSHIGVAKADQLQRTAVAEADSLAIIGEATATANAQIGSADANSKTRVRTSELNAAAIAGENEAAKHIANTSAERAVVEAEANRLSTTAQKVKAAKALEDSYSAEQAAEKARADKDQATLQANIIVPANIAKSKIEIEAEAKANAQRKVARGEADALFYKMEAEAKGDYARLSEQAKGIAELVDAAGSAENAIALMVADKLESLYTIRVEAIKNIKIDKITVWDQGSGNNGQSSTAGFLDGMLKAVPGFEEVFAMAGKELPSLLQGAGTKMKNELNAKDDKSKELENNKDKKINTSSSESKPNKSDETAK
jgi:flotillin